MSDGDDFCNLEKDLGGNLIPESAEVFLLDFLDVETLGIAYVSMLRHTIDLFFQNKWVDCQQNCTALLDITWEHLNTGHWKDVSIVWRQVYSIVSYLKVLSEFSIKKRDMCRDFSELIRTCDMGLLMGAPVLSNVLSKLASRLQEMHIQNLSNTDDCLKDASSVEPQTTEDESDMTIPVSLSPSRKVSVSVSPSIEHFQHCFLETETPLIIQGCMDFWPAMTNRRWSLSYFRRIAGYRLVPVEIGSKYTEDAWLQKLMTVNKFIDEYIVKRTLSTKEVGYLAQHQLFDQITELKNDVIIPSYCGLGDSDEVDVNAWFGPQGTVSPLHQDDKRNFLAQVVGHKYVRLYHCQHTPSIYPHSSHLLSNTSQVDVENPDFEKFPLFADLPFLECILSPGEMLYIPPMHWHYVRSLSTSFSVSFWWK